MGKPRFSRRQFLSRAAAGAGAVAAAGALAGTGSTAEAQPHPHAPPNAPEAHGGVASESFLFFTTQQGHTVDAIAERMIPADPLGPGAREAGVVFYIDRSLVGPYAHLKDVYRVGLEAIDTYSHATHGAAFRDLTPERQDAVLRAMDDGKATGFTAPTAKGFFELLLSHVREGMFSDPSHGGNRNFIGWRLLRHPGVQWQHPTTAQWDGYGPDVEIRAAGDWGFRR